MPYIGTYSQDEEDKKSSGDTQLAAPSAAVSTTSSSAPAQKAPTSSGAFTNLQRYITANADQSPSTAIAEKISNAGDQARSGLKSAQQSFTDKANQGYTRVDNSVIDKAASDPTHLTEEERARIQEQRNNSYKGPNDLNDVEGFVGTAGDNVKDALKATDTEQGQFSLLQRFLSRPGYSRGEQGLDQLLLKNTEKGKSDFDQVRANYGDIDSAYAKAQQAARDTSAAKKAEVSSGVDYANNTLSGSLQSIQKSVNDRVTEAQDEYNRAVADRQRLVQSMQTQYRVDPRNYLSLGPAPELGSVITNEEAARLNALSGLLDQPGQSFANVGTYDPSKAAVFNEQGFADAVAQGRGAYERSVNPIREEIRKLQTDPRGSGLLPGSGNNPNGIIANHVIEAAINERLNKINELNSYWGVPALSPFMSGGGNMRG